MATLPISLPIGYVLVYGTGTDTSTTGIQLPTTGSSPVRFGSIYQIWDGGAAFIYGGDNIMFKREDGTAILYNSIPYTMIPARLVTKETPLL